MSGSSLLTNPHCLASLAFIVRAVKINSLHKLSLPIALGNSCSVPKSALMPRSTSLMLNDVFFSHSLTSAANTKSTPAPIQSPCTAAMTGLVQLKTAEKQLCKSLIEERRDLEITAASLSPSFAIMIFFRSPISMPEEKFSPSAIRTIALVEASFVASLKQLLSSWKNDKFIAFIFEVRLMLTLRMWSPAFDTFKVEYFRHLAKAMRGELSARNMTSIKIDFSLNSDSDSLKRSQHHVRIENRESDDSGLDILS
mmetsp:Transcript_14951/g.21225  ORF Transcript_14951/g.21225 Transcript_14951/m.21225 type:complete len:254 (-) Transcript_14951:7-768(-)